MSFSHREYLENKEWMYKCTNLQDIFANTDDEDIQQAATTTSFRVLKIVLEGKPGENYYIDELYIGNSNNAPDATSKSEPLYKA